MGINVAPIGNHSLSFKKNSEDLLNEVEAKINDAFKAEILETGIRWEVRLIGKNSVNLFWAHPEHLYELDIDPYQISYLDDPFSDRYEKWCHFDSIFHENYKIYLEKIERAMGGDMVLFLADCNHFLSKYLYMDCTTPDEIKNLLREEIGPPSHSPQQAFDEHSYFIFEFPGKQ